MAHLAGEFNLGTFSQRRKNIVGKTTLGSFQQLSLQVWKYIIMYNDRQ